MNASWSRWFMRRAVALALVVVFVFGAAGQASAAGIVRYAKPAGLTTGSCSTWATACRLSRALSVAVSGDRIWVAKGTHRPTVATVPADPRTKTFMLKNGVAVYGGFAGTETQLKQRKPAVNKTILSGEIGAPGTADNAYHVVRANDVSSSARLDGFTITAGNADGSYPDDSGGGMYNSLSSPTLVNLTFSDNSAKAYGGAIDNYVSGPTLTNITFTGNTASYGGGMDSYSSTPTLTNVTFSGNTATIAGGGLGNSYGSDATLTNVTFAGNTAETGAGMDNWSSHQLLTNVTFSDNTATVAGGGMFSYEGSTTLTNVTFSGNTATQEGGGLYGSESVLDISNSLFWDDGAAGEIVNDPTMTSIVDSIVAGGCPADADCTNVIDADPNLGPLQNNGGFTQTMALAVGSVAIDAGGANSSCAPKDQRGVPRPQSSACDIGAYERTAVVYAKPGGLTSGSCEAWAHACKLSYALPLALSGQQIWAAAGTYQPAVATIPGDPRSKTFMLQDGVAVLGGFAGTETLVTQRNPASNVTILSGEIGAAGNADNAYHVVRAASLTSTAVLDGFTITGGNADGPAPDLVGGGMFSDSSSPTLMNLTFSGNTALNHGGGMYNYMSSPTLTKVTFSSNIANDSGGGMYNDAGSDPVLTNVTFGDNRALNNAGGMFNSASSPELSDVTFSANIASDAGGGMYNSDSDPELTNLIFTGNIAGEDGGGMLNWFSSPELTNATFSNNTAEASGGGMYNSGSSPALTNVALINNTAQDRGGGMFNENGSSPALMNVTFHGNYGWMSGGGMYNDSSNPTLTNATFSANRTEAGGGGGIHNYNSNPSILNSLFWAEGGQREVWNDGSVPTVQDSLLQGGCPVGASCKNVLNTDPVLAPLQYNGGFTQTMALGAGSTAIDAGGVNAGCALSDQRGVPRPQGGACDMGAYEAGTTATFVSDSGQDGWILESGEITGVGGTLSAAANTFSLGDDAARRQYRAALSFDTSSLPDDATIIFARLTVVRQSVVPAETNPFNLFKGLLIDVRKGYFGSSSALQAADFKAAANKSVGPFKPVPVGARYTIGLPSTAYPYINRLLTGDGLTQLRLRFALDDNNDATANYIRFYSGNAAANRPTLTIEYYVP